MVRTLSETTHLLSSLPWSLLLFTLCDRFSLKRTPRINPTNQILVSNSTSRELDLRHLVHSLLFCCCWWLWRDFCLFWFDFQLISSFSVNSLLIPWPWPVHLLLDFWCILDIVTIGHFIVILCMSLFRLYAPGGHCNHFPSFLASELGRVPYSQSMWNDSGIYNDSEKEKRKIFITSLVLCYFYWYP